MGQDDHQAGAGKPATARPAGLLVVRITSADIGKRVTIRHRIDDPTATLTDVLGYLRQWSQGVITVELASGEKVVIAETDLVAAKVIPEKSVRKAQPPNPHGSTT